jgi:hypothetical protein
MQIRRQAALFGLLAMMTICSAAVGQPVESARATRERAKADLIRAQEAFDRADEAYINALGGVVTQPAVTPLTPTPTSAGVLQSSVVTFSMSGVGALDANLFDYRGRLILDEEPGAWTQHASGAKYMVPSGTRSIAFEVQHNTMGDPIKPSWKTICQGNLPLKAATKIDIVIAQETTCDAR